MYSFDRWSLLILLPHWNGLGTDSVNVHIYTNMDEVELVLNGKSLGTKKVGKYDIPAWKVKYAPGKLVAKGKKGNKKYVETIETTDTPSALQLVSETGSELKNDGEDVALITVKVMDKKGRFVPTAGNYVNFVVKNGRVLGVGNGNPSCHEPDAFAAGEKVGRSAFSGCAQLIVAGDCSGLPVEVIATSDGLKESRLIINVK